MALQSFKAKVVEVNEVADQVLYIKTELVKPAEIEFRAGQFVMLHVPNDEGKIIKRAYSIASAPKNKNYADFAIKMLADGKASNYVREFKGGEEIQFDGPLGHFFLRPDHEKDLLFVGTGTGVAPLRSMIYEAIQTGRKNKMTLFFGVRNEKDMFLNEEFEKLAEENENFEYVMTLSGGSDDWHGNRGRVTEHVKELDFEPENLQVYLCGSMPMVNEVSEILIGKGVPKEEVLKEIY